MRVPLSFATLLTLFLTSGCVSFPGAHLVLGPSALERFDGPVVCGPMGFRRTPLESKWGEYVRVTVSSPSALEGQAFVHANGLAGEPRTWKTAEGALVIESRFENADPELPFVLSKDTPIDVTLTGLTTADGKCEGVVFTVEQGPLAPSIDERSWALELERRGGAELEARRAARRAEAARLAQLEVETSEGASFEAALGLNAAVVTPPELIARGEVSALVLGSRAAACGAQVSEGAVFSDASVAMSAAVRASASVEVARASEFGGFPGATAAVGGEAGCAGCTARAVEFGGFPAAGCGGCSASAVGLGATAPVGLNAAGCGGCTPSAVDLGATASVEVNAGCGGCSANAVGVGATAPAGVNAAGCGGCTASAVGLGATAPVGLNAAGCGGCTASAVDLGAPAGLNAEAGCGGCTARAVEFGNFPATQATASFSASGHATLGGCVTACPVAHSASAEVIASSVIRTSSVTAHVEGCVPVAPAPKAVAHVSSNWAAVDVAHSSCEQCTVVVDAGEWSSLPPVAPPQPVVQVDTWSSFSPEVPAPSAPAPRAVVVASVPPPSQVEVEVAVTPFEVVLPAIFDAFAHAAVPVTSAPPPAQVQVVPGSNTQQRPRNPPPPPRR
ncbi:MAG: hypothetical protein U0228_22645 [Myxococcaceae bacterium]